MSRTHLALCLTLSVWTSDELFTCHEQLRSTNSVACVHASDHPAPVAPGTSACPPYHLALVIGGLSAEMTLKTVCFAGTLPYFAFRTPSALRSCSDAPFTLAPSSINRPKNNIELVLA